MNSSGVMSRLAAWYAIPSLDASASYLVKHPRACIRSVGVSPILWIIPSSSIFSILNEIGGSFSFLLASASEWGSSLTKSRNFSSSSVR